MLSSSESIETQPWRSPEPTPRVSISSPTAQIGLAYLTREEKRLTGWKQGNTPEMRFETPAFGGGFFFALLLPPVTHRAIRKNCAG